MGVLPWWVVTGDGDVSPLVTVLHGGVQPQQQKVWSNIVSSGHRNNTTKWGEKKSECWFFFSFYFHRHSLLQPVLQCKVTIYTGAANTQQQGRWRKRCFLYIYFFATSVAAIVPTWTTGRFKKPGAGSSVISHNSESPLIAKFTSREEPRGRSRLWECVSRWVLTRWATAA